MLSDIEIASQKVMRPVLDIAGDLGIAEDELDLYGRYKAKLDDPCMNGWPIGRMADSSW